MRAIICGLVKSGLLALCITLAAANPAAARVDIDLNLSLFPQLVPVPGYPVYYAPREDWNYFFYDGMYWLYEDDNWYASEWYDGPWQYVDPEFVPVYVLRVPVRYYRRPPQYFYGWRVDAPPRWGYFWGDDWLRRHRDWDRWDHHRVPARAPLPLYQRDYHGDRYPRGQRQRELRDEHYHYQPHSAAVRDIDEHHRETPPQVDRPDRDNSPQRDRRDIQQAAPPNNFERPNTDRSRSMPPQNRPRESSADPQWQRREQPQRRPERAAPSQWQPPQQEPHQSDRAQPMQRQQRPVIPTQMAPQQQMPHQPVPQWQHPPQQSRQPAPQQPQNRGDVERAPHNERGAGGGHSRDNERGDHNGQGHGDRDR